MAQLTAQKILLTGITPVYNVAAVGGDTFLNNGRTFLHIKNDGVSAITATIDSKALSNFGTDVDVIVSIPAGSEKIIGTFDPVRFDNDLGIANISYSSVTSVTIAITSY
jgi:hypothetical protein